MNRPVLLAALALSWFAGSTFAQLPPIKKPPRAKTPLVVHEWGTFTSMVGSDGIGLEGLHHEEESLPDFVYHFGGKARNGRAVHPHAYLGRKLGVPLFQVTQKMETPVIYFYTDEPVKVELRVDFRNGLMSQWYPAADQVGPKPSRIMQKGVPLDLRKVKNSFLKWSIDVLPREGKKAPAEMPPVKPDDPWGFARKVDAAWVRTRNRNADKKHEAEAYLFYRGLGTFEMPVTVDAGYGGFGKLVNDGPGYLDGVFALEVRPEGARFQDIGQVGGKSAVLIELGDIPFRPTETVVKELEAAVKDRLIGNRLFEKEADAMIATWTRSWFRTEGTRVFYVVPTPMVESILPLRMRPVPHDLVRVLVGRLEYITPEVEHEVAAALRDHASDDARLVLKAKQRLDRLGRFLEPHVRSVLRKKNVHPETASEGRRMLKTLESN